MNSGNIAPSRKTPERSGFKPAVISFLAYWAVYLLASTLRFRHDDPTGLIRRDTKEATIFALWHNTIGFMPWWYKMRLRRTRVATLVSASRDGEILARIMMRLGFQPVRGSTSRRGPQSLLEMARWVGQGYDGGITPDGPRGPAEVVQEGIIHLAKITGVAITPLSCRVSHCLRAKSWDRFIIPIPFARCIVRIGAPIVVPRDADDAMMEKLRLQLQEELKRSSS